MLRPLPLLVLALGACSTEPPAVDPPEPTLRRLTQAQYANALHDLFGEELTVTDRLEPDVPTDGLIELGASITTISPRGVELYESAAFDAAAQVMDDPAWRAEIVGCEPAGTVDAACAENFLSEFGRRAWRRPLTSDELGVWVGISGTAANELGDFWDGLEFGITGILTSPNFLYRVELGESDPDQPGGYRFSDYEMAERLSFLLWNSIPDDELLDAAEAGELTTRDGLLVQTERLLESPRAREGLRTFFRDYLELYEVEHVSKDPYLYNHWSSTIGVAAEEETLRLFEDWVFDSESDYRDLFTTTRSFVDPELAALYNVRAPSREGFEEVAFTEAAGRAGLLGHASLLAMHAHPTLSSPTLRGKFIRQTLLCQPLPPPPAGLNTAIPEADEALPTMRDRLMFHMQEESCASCHALTDPIGLGLENYDGIGRYRASENGATIDPSGDFGNGEYEFLDALELGQQVSKHPDLGPCFTSNLYRYATGHRESFGEAEAIIQLSDDFKGRRYRIAELVVDTVLSNGFRKAGAIQ
ncbi:MAG: DUF1592 domain-containing protein [Deltaproteobacteria bacterium]|nr:MAG: DUF1592 domain-containing protein [Deltaproteobacteria bacterium]